MAETIKISKSFIQNSLIGISIILVIIAFTLFSSPYTAPIVFTTLLLVWGAYYAFTNKEEISEMCCMMSGMTYGMMSGFFIGALVGLATSNFIVAMIVGTVVGVLFGIPVGRIGGPLGRMEGVMAGPMGGIMGGMTGVMARFFDVNLFMPFIVIVVIFTVWEMTNVIKKSSKISRNFLVIGAIISVLALSSTFVNNYNGELGTTGLFAGDSQPQQIQQQAVGAAQEVTIKMGTSTYSPNYITVKKDTPVKIKLQAEPNAGCTRSIVFPELGIKKTVKQGGTDTIEFTPTKAGTYHFACAMSMATGTLVVQ